MSLFVSTLEWKPPAAPQWCSAKCPGVELHQHEPRAERELHLTPCASSETSVSSSALQSAHEHERKLQLNPGASSETKASLDVPQRAYQRERELHGELEPSHQSSRGLGGPDVFTSRFMNLGVNSSSNRLRDSSTNLGSKPPGRFVRPQLTHKVTFKL